MENELRTTELSALSQMYIRAHDDIGYFARTLVKVINPEGTVNLRWPDESFIEALYKGASSTDQQITGTRRSGRSLIAAVVVAHRLIFGSSTSTFYLAPNTASCTEFLDKVKTILDNCPDEFGDYVSTRTSIYMGENQLIVGTQCLPGHSFNHLITDEVVNERLQRILEVCLPVISMHSPEIRTSLTIIY